MSPLPLSTNAADRALGVVYNDESSEPRTHALVIGVGSYPWSDLPEINSPPASAKAVADWLLGYAPTCLRNPERPLGSVTILLSEPQPDKVKAKSAAEGPSSSKASYQGVPVPRADQLSAKAAVDAWAERLARNSNNMAFVYFCGHGVSENGRSILIMESFGKDATKPFRGLIDVENLVSAAGTYPAPAQLLFFDCCRGAGNLGLQPGAQLPDQLLEHTGRRRPDVGQIALFATLLDEKAGGRRNKASLFTASLLSAFDIAATQRGRKWVVRSGLLCDTVGECLSLYSRSMDDVQRPAGSLSAATFDINFPTFGAEVRTFISLSDPSRWSEAEITISLVESGKPTPVEVVRGSQTSDPFYERTLKSGAGFRYMISAKLPDQTFEITDVLVSAPRAFLQLPEDGTTIISVDSAPASGSWSEELPGTSRRSGSTSSVRDGEEGASDARGDDGADPGDDFGDSPEPELAAPTIEILVSGPMKVEGVIATVEALDEDRDVEEAVVALGGDVTVFEETAGNYNVSVVLPDGRRLTRTVAAHDGEVVRVRFDAGQSPREFLDAAMVAGIVGPQGLAEPIGYSTSFDSILVRPIAPPRFDGGGDAPAGLEVTAEFYVEADFFPPYRYAVVRIDDQPRCRYRPDERGYFPPMTSTSGNVPLWAEVLVGERREVCVVPSIGKIGSGEDWLAEVAIDRRLRGGHNLAAGVVRSTAFSGLLGHLARHDFERAALVLRTASEAGYDPFSDRYDYNPLIRTAAALIVAATSRAQVGPNDPDLESLARHYAGLPDTSIALARRRWSLARSDVDLEAALALFREGARRGVPVFTLSLDWLAKGLAALGAESEAAAVTELSQRVDLSRCFTSIGPASKPCTVGEGAAGHRETFRPVDNDDTP